MQNDQQKLRDQYKLVKEYLKQHPYSNAMEISTATGIPVSTVLQLVKEGYICVAKSEFDCKHIMSKKTKRLS